MKIFSFLKLKHLYFLYFMFFWKYFSFKKLSNWIINICEFKLKKIEIKSVPLIFYFDVSNRCVLSCPLCPTGRKDKSQTKGTMSFSDFKVNFDKVKDYLFFVWLYNWGEPFLCKDIFKIVDYCHKNNVGVRLHTNLNCCDKESLKKIVDSKIDYISVSIDGATQEKYSFYRRNGSLDKVFNNLKELNRLKKASHSVYPRLIWQFLTNNINKSEIEQAKKYSREFGMDFFEDRPLFLFNELDSKFDEGNYNKFLSNVCNKSSALSVTQKMACRYLWQGFAVNPNLTFAPCCCIYSDKDIFGDLRKDGNVSRVLNNRMWTESRKLFKYKKYKPVVYTPCLRCDWFTKP